MHRPSTLTAGQGVTLKPSEMPSRSWLSICLMVSSSTRTAIRTDVRPMVKPCTVPIAITTVARWAMMAR